MAVRRAKLGLKTATTMFDIPDHDSPHSLHGRFYGVVLNEAHLAKNAASHANVAVRWL